MPCRGQRQIALTGNAGEHAPAFRRRYEGYTHALREFGLEPAPALQVDADTSERAGQAGIETLRERGVSFDAAFGASDLIAISAFHGGKNPSPSFCRRI